MSVTEIKEVLQNCLDRAVAENEVAGCTFCLIRNGEEKLYLESGYADREAENRLRETACTGCIRCQSR